MRSAHYPNQEGMQCYLQNDQSPYFDRHFVIDGITFDCIQGLIRENGFRKPSFSSKIKGKKRIVVIGDSFTFGEGVKEEDSFPRLIEKDLNIETFNLAMQGMNTRLERIAYEHLDWLQPNPVMLVYTTNYTMPVMETINAGARWKESIKIPP